MIEIVIPGRGQYKLEHLVLDLNGTIALDGEIIEGVEERLQQLSSMLSISIITADTQGNAQRLEESSQLKIHKIDTGEEGAQKLKLVQQLAGENTVSIGNGSNDVAMLKEAALGICVLGQEGAAVEAMSNSDLVVPDINTALDLLLNPRRLIASLRR